MKILIKGIKICLAIILVGSLTACGGKKIDDSVLRLAVNDEATSLNFLYTILEPNVDIIFNVQEGLVQYDEKGELQMATAEQIDISEDMLTYTIKIKNDAVWANGDLVTAADFVYSIHTRVEDKEAVYAQYYRYLKNGEAVLNGDKSLDELGVKASDDKTLIFTLDEAHSLFLDLLAFEIFLPLNQSFYEEVGATNYGTTADTILANGPFTLSEYSGEQGWTYRKNETYWGAADTALSQIDVRVVKEASTQQLMWDKGELDVLQLSIDQIELYQDDPQLKTSLKSQMNYFYLSNNTGAKNELYANKNFRAAIAHSIDKTVITDKILKDGSIPADGFVPRDILKQDGEDFRDFTPNYSEPMFDVVKAKEYLEKAKAETGQENFVIDLEVYDLGNTMKVYESVQGQVQENLPGVTVNLNQKPTQTYFQMLYEYQTPAAASQWEPDYLDVENYFLLFSEAASQNFSKWSNPIYEAKYIEAESPALASNPAARWQLYAEAEQALVEDYTIIPIFQSGATYLVRDNVKGFYISPALPHENYRGVSKTV